MTKYKSGKIIKGTVSGIESYGIFITCDEFYSGLVHISEISHGFVKSPSDFVKIGEIINVEILEVDEKVNQLKLSIKNINYKINKESRKKKIIETPLGFKTLQEMLPNWILKSVKKS